MAPSEDVILYRHKCSPYAQRVHAALVAKGIPFKLIDIDFENKPVGLLEANPIHGKVPALVHNGNPISESLVILEYLEEAWPEATPLMARDAVGKSKVRFWADYMYKGFLKLQSVARAKPNTPEREAAAAEVPKFLGTLQKTMTEYSAEGPFFTGEKFGYLDVILSPLTCWEALFKEIGTPIPSAEEMPRLHKCVEAIRGTTACKEGVASGEEMVAFYYYMVNKFANSAAAAHMTED